MSTKPWGCWNRVTKDYYYGQDGYIVDPVSGTMTIKAVKIDDRGTKDCQYRKETPEDPRCVGCRVP